MSANKIIAGLAEAEAHASGHNKNVKVREFMVNTTVTEDFPKKCRWCGLIHGPYCSVVEAIEYYPDGTVKRVTFRPEGSSPSK